MVAGREKEEVRAGEEGEEGKGIAVGEKREKLQVMKQCDESSSRQSAPVNTNCNVHNHAKR